MNKATACGSDVDLASIITTQCLVMDESVGEGGVLQLECISVPVDSV